MRASLFVGGTTAILALAAAAACTSSGETEPTTPAEQDSGILGSSDGAVVDVGSDTATPPVDGGVDGGDCSDAGWCETPLPGPGLTVKDIWPLEGRAFAVAESATQGVRVLEWDGASGPTGTWSYIDDGTQNDERAAPYAGGLWAPDADDLYYTVAPGYVYHGTRPVPPQTAWSWSRTRLEDHSHEGDVAHASHDHGFPTNSEMGMGYPALGVWGTSRDNVYAWYSNTVFHWKAEAGAAPAWVAEYSADDFDTPNEHLFFVGAAGTGPDDIWFSGVRDGSPSGRSCVILVRKTAGSFNRVADGVVPPGFAPCAARDGFQKIDGANGWLTDLHALGPSRFVGLKGARDVLQLTASADGGIATDLSPFPSSLVSNNTPTSVWATSNEVWLSTVKTYATAAFVARGVDVWNGGSYELSTLALRHGPITSSLFRIRGTSSTNLWVVGVQHALHKTTP
ncbi:hypothetical protein AKJ09_09102 [Labilithrix luteola]|uniref:Uncharacterized protein n=1 Tax=Labilithrix luteola TaxID=1391654 RepID=A0A0K1Q9M6_9BACT|nr:hypothetical protein [Labilithrix luteola]AKV02439.1 hypothetical protein AKJ09_09102 [Labilithrix luteola]